jgi:hypothetical protein
MTRHQRNTGFIGTRRPVTVALFGIVLLGVLDMHGLGAHGAGDMSHQEAGTGIAALSMSTVVEPPDVCNTPVCPPALGSRRRS